MLKPTVRKAPLALAIGLTTCVVLPALADGSLEEVVVTAQKREQSLQQTPIAISSLSSAAIERQDIRDVKSLNGLVPNMRLASPPTASTGSTVNIRGAVTINPALTLESTVGMYLDGIYLGKSVGSVFDVADLERVEVLRGPQGTLYGKNTLGGAINLVTKQPTGEFGGDFKLTMGNYGLMGGRLSLDLPALGTIGEGAGKLSTKIVISRTTRDGFYTNRDSDLPLAEPASGRDFGNVNSTSGRFVALWQPTESIDVQYAYDASRIDQRPQFFQINRLDPALQPSLGQFASASRLSSGSQNDALHDRADVDGHSLIASWNLGDTGILGDVTLKSLSGYRQVDALDEQDWDGSPYPLLHSGRDMTYRAVSQEFQMLGETDSVNYVLGLYYFKESGHVLNPQELTLIGVPPMDSRYGLDNKAWAAFTQVEWTPPILDERLTITAGARYTREDKSIDRYLNVGGFTVVPESSFDKDYGNFSPALTLSYQLTYDLNVYAKVAKGWKAGVFNAESGTLAELNSPVKEETVTSYEVGVKSKWFDNRLQANLAAFWDKHKDMQISVFHQTESLFSNAGAATIKGLELEVTALPFDNLEISLGYGYTDADYSEYMDMCRPTPSGRTICDGHPAGQPFDAKNVNKFPYTPKNTANLGVQYNQPLPVGEALARVDWIYTDNYVLYPDPFNYENTSVHAYQLVNARLGWEKVPVADAQLAVSMWVKNLTDKRYRASALEWGPLTSVHYGDPRTFGVDVSVKF